MEGRMNMNVMWYSIKLTVKILYELRFVFCIQLSVLRYACLLAWFKWYPQPTIHPSTHPGPLSLPITKSGNWSHTSIAHVFVAYMIIKLDYELGGHFKGYFVAKNSTINPEWHKLLWIHGTLLSHHSHPDQCPTWVYRCRLEQVKEVLKAKWSCSVWD